MPLLWILPASCTWLALGLCLLAMPVCWPRYRQPAFHVLAIGSIAGLIMGMITRIAPDHTGYMLKADARETVMYLLMQVGVAVRLLAAVGRQTGAMPR